LPENNHTMRIEDYRERHRTFLAPERHGGIGISIVGKQYGESHAISPDNIFSMIVIVKRDGYEANSLPFQRAERRFVSRQFFDARLAPRCPKMHEQWLLRLPTQDDFFPV